MCKKKMNEQSDELEKELCEEEALDICTSMKHKMDDSLVCTINDIYFLMCVITPISV